MTIKVLLIVQEGRPKQKYLDALTGCGVQVFTTSSFTDLSEEICSYKYHGLFLDLPTKMKAIRENKNYVYHLVGKFPVAHLQTDDRTGELRCYHFGKKSDDSLSDFINTQCSNFIPQRIRDEPRVGFNLHVSLYKNKDNKRPERSVTMNISTGGCFIFSSHRWKEGNNIWLKFNEIDDLTLIQAQVRTVLKWGESQQIPGIGVKFINLSQSKAEEIVRLLKLDR